MNTTLITLVTGRRRALGLSAAVLITAMTTGCEMGLGGDEDRTDAAPSPSARGASDGGASPVVDEGAAARGIDPTTLGDPVASAEVAADVDGDPDATITVALYGLFKEGKTLTAVYSFTVKTTKAASDTKDSIYGYLGNQGWHPYAVDTVNLNRHDPLKSDKGAIQTDIIGPTFRPGQTLYGFAAFAAPPEDVTTMSVQLVEPAPLAQEVPIS